MGLSENRVSEYHRLDGHFGGIPNVQIHKSQYCCLCPIIYIYIYPCITVFSYFSCLNHPFLMINLPVDERRSSFRSSRCALIRAVRAAERSWLSKWLMLMDGWWYVPLDYRFVWWNTFTWGDVWTVGWYSCWWYKLISSDSWLQTLYAHYLRIILWWWPLAAPWQPSASAGGVSPCLRQPERQSMKRDMGGTP